MEVGATGEKAGRCAQECDTNSISPIQRSKALKFNVRVIKNRNFEVNIGLWPLGLWTLKSCLQVIRKSCSVGIDRFGT